MQYTLKRISRQDKVSKAGKPYVSVGIQVAEFGEQWINGFGNKENAQWKEGDQVELTITDNVYNGKTTKQFTSPDSKAVQHLESMKLLNEMATRVGSLNAKVDKILKHLSGEDRLDITSNGLPAHPTFEREESGLEGF